VQTEEICYNIPMEKQIAHPGHFAKISTILLTLALLASLGGGAYLGYEDYMLRNQKSVLENDITTANNEATLLQAKLASTTMERDGLATELGNQKAMVDALTGQVNGIVGNVGTLVKLSQTDPELLKKYSKIYFLNENYQPDKLIRLDTSYTLNQKEIYFRSDVWPYLKNLMDLAKSNGMTLQIISGYRSFDTQVDLKTSYKVTFGTNSANQFSADQGFSEHQLGSAVDFTTIELGADFDTFDKTKAYAWLKDNAYKYGFELSYPINNSYYKFEPWHWRFVGRQLAEKLHTWDKNFYDLDQREIDSYLQYFFD